MSATGIGAAVRRKEDLRFITGKGQYTDDINRPGQTYIYFVRSPHAHARIKKIDSAEAARMSGVVAVLTGADLANDKIGNLICGWAISSKDGSPMKMSAHPAIANVKACHVGDAVAVVIAETLGQAKDAGEKVKVDYEVLPAVADPAQAQSSRAPLIHDDDPVMRRIEEPAVGRRGSRPRSAMKKDYRNAARATGLFPIEGMYRIDLEQTGLIWVDRREQLGAWHQGADVVPRLG